MQTDIRFPIGLLFTIIGVMITIFGFVTGGAEIYKHSLGININIWSGICLIIFGVIMLVMALNAQKKDKAQAKT
jgi:putative Mn2+ efflux pump MntP